MDHAHGMPEDTGNEEPVRGKARLNKSWRSDKGSSTARGYGSNWRKFRNRFLKENPLCEICLEVGVIEAATVVDHIEPHRGNMELFWQTGNHQALCARCHSGRKQVIENGNRPQARFDMAGKVVW